MSQLDADVIIIGGGPAGVAAALALRKRNIQKVMLLERESALGGATRHCLHSPFGMREFGWFYFGPAYAGKLAQQAQDAGVEICTQYSVTHLEDNHRVHVATPNGVQLLRAKRIMVATGARETPRSARLLSGDRPIGILTTGALQAHLAFHGLLPFSRPLIVGSELVSLSAFLTCISHGIKPVKMIESRAHLVARPPFSWLASRVVARNTELSDIIGHARVEAATICTAGHQQTLPCDGILLTGEFTPESALLLQSPIGIAEGSRGPLIDQYGRCVNPGYFAAGNLLRAIETGGWAYREGRAVGSAIADDLRHEMECSPPIPITFDAPIKLVVPGMLRKTTKTSINPAFQYFQLRMLCRVYGELGLQLDGHTIWKKRSTWWPERRITIPIPANACHAGQIHFYFQEERK